MQIISLRSRSASNGMSKLLTLCVIHDNEKILLGMKKKGFGEGKWNGFGGKVEEGESIENAAHRELKEEAGIEASGLKKRGVINFEFEGDPKILEVHVFSASDFIGEPRESDEMKPQWFGIDEIPYDGMWPDDKHWLPVLLSGKNFKGSFHFRGHNEILRHELREV